MFLNTTRQTVKKCWIYWVSRFILGLLVSTICPSTSSHTPQSDLTAVSSALDVSSANNRSRNTSEFTSWASTLVRSATRASTPSGGWQITLSTSTWAIDLLRVRFVISRSSSSRNWRITSKSTSWRDLIHVLNVRNLISRKVTCCRILNSIVVVTPVILKPVPKLCFKSQNFTKLYVSLGKCFNLARIKGRFYSQFSLS